jgi:hypothetical protein
MKIGLACVQFPHANIYILTNIQAQTYSRTHSAYFKPLVAKVKKKIRSLWEIRNRLCDVRVLSGLLLKVALCCWTSGLRRFESSQCLHLKTYINPSKHLYLLIQNLGVAWKRNPQRHETTFVMSPHLYLNLRTTRTKCGK